MCLRPPLFGAVAIPTQGRAAPHPVWRDGKREIIVSVLKTLTLAVTVVLGMATFANAANYHVYHPFNNHPGPYWAQE
jgi:hypothetical protein